MTFSNNDEDLVNRLLSLYPLELLKKEYQTSGTSEAVYRHIFQTNTSGDIREDALRLMPYCRQHIYLFHLTKAAAAANPKFIRTKCDYENHLKAPTGADISEYLYPLNYEFIEINNRTADTKQQKHLWPIKIVRMGTCLQIRFVTMEKNMRSSKGVIFRSRDTDDEILVNHILSSYAPSGSIPTRVDFNKGIKHLWAIDKVDAPRVTHKSAKSVDNSHMDYGFTFKQQYPARYTEVVKHPLRKTVFTVLNDPNLPVAFLADPGDGFISFARFQENDTAIDSLIDAILSNN